MTTKAVASQGTANIASQPPEARKKQGRIFLQVSEGAQTCGHFDSRLPDPGTVK